VHDAAAQRRVWVCFVRSVCMHLATESSWLLSLTAANVQSAGSVDVLARQSSQRGIRA